MAGETQTIGSTSVDFLGDATKAGDGLLVEITHAHGFRRGYVVYVRGVLTRSRKDAAKTDIHAFLAETKRGPFNVVAYVRH